MNNNNITNYQATNVNIGEELSQYNKEILVGYGKELHQDLQGSDGVNFEPGIWDFCKSLIPKGLSSALIGEQLSKEFTTRFGKPITNEAVNMVVKEVLQPNMKKTHTLGAFAKKQFTEAPKLLVGEAVKWSINSKAMPYICSALGGWGIPALCVLVETAYNKYLKGPKHLETLDKLPLDKLFQFDAETGRLEDTFGNVLSNEDIKDINEVINQYDLTAKLLTLNKEEVKDFIGEYIGLEEKSFQKDGIIAMVQVYIEALVHWCHLSNGAPSERYAYRDGQVLSSEEVQDMKEAVRFLTNHNPTRKKKEIINLIKGIATHITAKPPKA